ncbi:MAG: nucleotide exchange factor GrpE [Planctomycetota bacterium]|nr:nucleotide exchange factor GrpE [Planctomycetota bacterium]
MADDNADSQKPDPKGPDGSTPADLERELEETEACAEEARPPTPEEELARLRDKLKRVEAEFVNETKRIRRQAEGDRKYAIETVIVDLLPVIDALHGARDGLADDEASKPMREGLSLVEQQLQGVFKRYGVSSIEAQGKPFDPARHQAMMMVERDDVDPQTVCDVLRVGYELHGRVVRPAEVLVAKAPAAEAPAAGDE